LNTIKKLFQLTLALAVCVALTGADYLGQKQIERSKNIMGTAFTITIFNSGGVSLERNSYLVDKAFETIERLSDKMFSENPESLVWKINHSKSGETFLLDEDTFFVVRESLRLAKISDGAFDPTDAPLRDLWMKAREGSVPPGEEEIKAALTKVGYLAVLLDTDSRLLSLKQPGVRINVDEPARGYAADKALLQLKSQGVSSAMIKVGESTRWIGLAQESRYWRFGIDHPRKVDEFAAILEIETERATSSTGDYDDFFIYKGDRYPLVINPKTGWPPMNDTVGVTVTAENIAFGNLLSRLLFILGPEKGYEFIERYKEEGINAVFIEENGPNRLTLSSSEGLHNALKDINL
jgi:thiamine biosynthesis lipoprotein